MKYLIIFLVLSSCTIARPGYKQFEVVEGNITILTDQRTGHQSGVIQETVSPFRKWYFKEAQEIKKKPYK